MYFASFSTLLACGFWRLVRDRFSQLARTFAREALQRVGRRARFARRTQAVSARRCCSALGSALSFLPMFSPVVPSNYSFKATVIGRHDNPAPSAAP
ncbi:MAG: hypothetical protein ACYC9L_16245 [Sulfuricaulis sp.]